MLWGVEGGERVGTHCILGLSGTVANWWKLQQISGFLMGSRTGAGNQKWSLLATLTPISALHPKDH